MILHSRTLKYDLSGDDIALLRREWREVGFTIGDGKVRSQLF